MISGEVAERLNALVLKTSKGASPSRVRIPPSPPLLKKALIIFMRAFFSNDSQERQLRLYVTIKLYMLDFIIMILLFGN